jgi:hypothetical protein
MYKREITEKNMCNHEDEIGNLWSLNAPSVFRSTKTFGDISIAWIPDFIFMNYEFQLHEFIISTSWIYDFNFMNSRFQLHELTVLTSRIHDFTFTNLRFHEVEIVNSWSLKRKFVKLKSWIHEEEFIKLKSWILNVENGNSGS